MATTMDATKVDEVLEAVEEIERNQEVSIIKLSEPISSDYIEDSRQRTSDVSNASLDAPTPAILEADLQHYKELFAKLRFSYVEQVTKEKFIRAIVGDPPLIATPQENLDLEKQNQEVKAQLKSLKLEVADMVAALEKQGRELSERYEIIQTGKAKLEELPARITELETHVADLKASQAPGQDPHMILPYAKTLELLEERTREQQELDRELEQLRAKVPRKMKEAERLEAELKPLEAKRQNSAAAAKEAQRRKEASLGGAQDDLEERGRWLRASETVLRRALELD